MNTHVNETSRTMSPSLTEQTPGLDKTAPLRDRAMREVAWMRENRAVLSGIVGGLVAIGLGTWLVLRARRPTRMDILRARGLDAYGWVRDRIPKR
jgi:hypothetical protein